MVSVKTLRGIVIVPPKFLQQRSMLSTLSLPENDLFGSLQRLADLHGMDALGQQNVARLHWMSHHSAGLTKLKKEYGIL